MKRRLYFLLPGVNSARKMMDDLLLARVNADSIHFLAKPGTPMGDLPEATISERTDLIEGWEIGMGLGALLGLALGLIALSIPTWWYTVPLPTVTTLLICTLAGLLVGGLMTALVATTIPNAQLKQFEGQVAKGQVLMMVLAPFHQVREIRQKIVDGHPEADYRGTWPTDHVIFP
ncbi:MAG: hypothetical protein EXR38_01960 [Methylotenera sp.]|nr:hypothetical protein [Methylotenera sp.]MSP99264.1 hypothetical protein [Methylotenera sp.]